MPSHVLISICIPAYQRTDFLRRLLDSLVVQVFRDFEVIVTDDSPDLSVKALCAGYEGRLPLQYYRNEPSKGTPENWNEGIRRAKGEWIKIMHDDDWFATPDALEVFAATVRAYPQVSFIFSDYRNVYADGSAEAPATGPRRLTRLSNVPAILFASNVIGPPSCVLFKNTGGLLFDKRLKWLVDIDFYIRYLATGKPFYIPQPLVNIGISDTQVTRVTFGRREVEIPEAFMLMEKYGTSLLGNWRIFDAWWRLMRNLRIRDVKDIREAGYTGIVPGRVAAMVRLQGRFSSWMLDKGIFSKLLMFYCFIFMSSGRDII